MKNKLKDLLELFIVFFRIGLFTFGGGYVMISFIQQSIIEKKKWLSEEEMLDIIAIAESTPGPISVNTATFVGFKRAGIIGGIISTLAIALPSLIIISIIAYFYNDIVQIEIIQRAFKGIICVVAALILVSAIKLFKGNLKSSKIYISLPLAIAALALSLFTGFNAIFMIIIGGFLGFIIYSFILKKEELK